MNKCTKWKSPHTVSVWPVYRGGWAVRGRGARREGGAGQGRQDGDLLQVLAASHWPFCRAAGAGVSANLAIRRR